MASKGTVSISCGDVYVKHLSETRIPNFIYTEHHNNDSVVIDKRSRWNRVHPNL